MDQFRSPIKHSSKSTSKLTKSVTLGKQSKYKQQSESKNNASFIKDISERPFYKNLLNKLLRCQNLTKFVKEAQKYVELSQQIIRPFKLQNPNNEKSRNESYQYGRALLKDGSFIRYYCKLVVKQFKSESAKVKEMFFQKYRHQVCLREKMFFDYFKEEVIESDDLTFSFSKSKAKDKTHSKSVSHKKAKTELNFQMRENDKNIQNLTTITAIDHQDSSNSVSVKEVKLVSSKSEKKIKIVHFQAQAVEENYEEDFPPSPRPTYKSKKKETEEERELRLSGIVKPNSSKKSQKKNQNIIKFQDALKSNQKLKEIYETILKEKEEKDKLRVEQSQDKPVVRKSLNRAYMEALDMRIKPLTGEDKKLLGQIEQEIIAHYPTIHLLGNKKGMKVDAQRQEGFYKCFVIEKAVLTDVHHYLEPDYIGIIISKMTISNIKNLSPCVFEPDERVEVLMLDYQ